MVARTPCVSSRSWKVARPRRREPGVDQVGDSSSGPRQPVQTVLWARALTPVGTRDCYTGIAIR
jgi:hypothetical protein